jgi:hypothetical protein
VTDSPTPVEVAEALYAAWQARLAGGPQTDPRDTEAAFRADMDFRRKRINARAFLARRPSRVPVPRHVAVPMVLPGVARLRAVR